MQTVYSAPNLSLVSVIQSVLHQHGIECWIKNEFLSAGIGELPPIDCWPQLCVEDDDLAAAKQAIEEDLAETAGTAWICGLCGEETPVRFLLVAGKPLGDPIAWRGPIVMNTKEELDTAFAE